MPASVTLLVILKIRVRIAVHEITPPWQRHRYPIIECQFWAWNNWNGTKGGSMVVVYSCSKEFCNETIDLGGKSSQICIDNCFYWQKTWNSPVYYYLRPPLFRSVCSTGQINTAIVSRASLCKSSDCEVSRGFPDKGLGSGLDWDWQIGLGLADWWWINRFFRDWHRIVGLADFPRIGLADWWWICRFVYDWHPILGLVMDWQIGDGLTDWWWIGRLVQYW